jgi:hypothetical protein
LSSESEDNHFGSGSDQFKTTTAGIRYAYSKTDGKAVDHWSLQISRSRAQSGTEVGDESLAWSWTKTGLLSETGENAWSELLSHAQQGTTNRNYAASITATPDQISAKELNYSDDLAAELLQLLEQAGESPGTDLSQSRYLDKLAFILDQTSALLEGEPAAQLQAQKPDLLAIGQLAEQWQCYELLDPVVGGLFSEALAVQSSLDAQLFATDFKWFVKAGSEGSSVQSLLFPAKLLAAARTQPELAKQISSPQFTEALVALARSYAALDPSPVAPENEPPHFFLHTLWQAQNPADIQKGADELSSSVGNSSNCSQLIDFQGKLLTTLKLVPSFEPALSDPSFVDSILDLAIDYVRFKDASTNTDIDLEEDSFLFDVWKATDESGLKIAANNLFIPANGSFNDEKLNLYDAIANRRGRGTSGYNYDSIRRPHSATVVANAVTLYLLDIDQEDGDAVAISLNGTDLGISIPISSRPVGIPLTLTHGSNLVTVTALNTGSTGPNTVGVSFSATQTDPVVHPYGYFHNLNLQAGSSFDFTVGFPQVPVDARRYPDIAEHVVDAWSYGYPRILTIDRNQQRRDQRRKESQNRYLNNPDNPDQLPGQDLDEYPPAMFIENYGRAHVRPINEFQNRGAGAVIGRLLKPYSDGDKVEIITNYGEVFGNS